jgi:hypothetical protein
MQVLASSLDASGRPHAPADCQRCCGSCKLHCHGSYQRHAEAGGERKVSVKRYICLRCGHTWSVIPPDMLPYRSIPVSRFCALVDGQTAQAGGDARSPPATQVEAGCVRRGLKILSVRIPLLCSLLGQLMPLPGDTGILWFWQALRKLGPPEDTLARLARDFKTSLLACYRSLRPHWQRERSPA